MSKRRVIVDVDVGVDDYMALLLLFHAEKLGEVKIEAIICTDGNTTRENVCKNVVRMLEALNRTDVPVYRGASRALIHSEIEFFRVHGLDGFGDLEHESEPNLCIIRNEPAAMAIRELVVNNPGEISIICIAALTNLALALRIDEEVCSKIRDLWIMGGNHTAVGNITPSAEFNFYKDPEAAFMIFESVTQPIYVLTWETAIRTNISRDYYDETIGRRREPALQLLNRAEEQWRKVATRKKWTPCDAFLIAAFLDPEKHIVKKTPHCVSIELHGSQTRGQVVLDHRKTKPMNATIIEEVSDEHFKELVRNLVL